MQTPLNGFFKIGKLFDGILKEHTLHDQAGKATLGVANDTIKIELVPVFKEFAPVCWNYIILIYSIGNVSYGDIISKDFPSGVHSFFPHFPTECNALIQFTYNETVKEIKGAELVFPDFTDMFKKGNVFYPFHSEMMLVELDLKNTNKSKYRSKE